MKGRWREEPAGLPEPGQEQGLGPGGGVGRCVQGVWFLCVMAILFP